MVSLFFRQNNRCTSQTAVAEDCTGLLVVEPHDINMHNHFHHAYLSTGYIQCLSGGGGIVCVNDEWVRVCVCRSLIDLGVTRR